MATATPSNYPKIELAVSNLVQANLGWATSIGDWSKLVETTPLLVITHGVLHSPLTDRRPGYERLEWTLPLHLLFDYTSDAEAHALMRTFRVNLLQLMMQHRYLDDGAMPYPAGYNGQCLDSKILRGLPPVYPEIDGRVYVQAVFELWVMEQVPVTYP